jgi:hypothetical protein
MRDDKSVFFFFVFFFFFPTLRRTLQASLGGKLPRKFTILPHLRHRSGNDQ